MTTITFGTDGPATVTTEITATVIKIDPDTGKSKTESLDPITVTHSVDRDIEGRIIVDGKVADRSWGDNIRTVANLIAFKVDPVGALIHNGGDLAGHIVDKNQGFIRDAIMARYRYDQRNAEFAAKARAATWGWLKMVGHESWEALKRNFFGPIAAQIKMETCMNVSFAGAALAPD